jgi:hypothetical protein
VADNTRGLILRDFTELVSSRLLKGTNGMLRLPRSFIADKLGATSPRGRGLPPHPPHHHAPPAHDQMGASLNVPPPIPVAVAVPAQNQNLGAGWGLGADVAPALQEAMHVTIAEMKKVYDPRHGQASAVANPLRGDAPAAPRPRQYDSVGMAFASTLRTTLLQEGAVAHALTELPGYLKAHWAELLAMLHEVKAVISAEPTLLQVPVPARIFG